MKISIVLIGSDLTEAIRRFVIVRGWGEGDMRGNGLMATQSLFGVRKSSGSRQW